MWKSSSDGSQIPAAIAYIDDSGKDRIPPQFELDRPQDRLLGHHHDKCSVDQSRHSSKATTGIDWFESDHIVDSFCIAGSAIELAPQDEYVRISAIGIRADNAGNVTVDKISWNDRRISHEYVEINGQRWRTYLEVL